MIVRPKPNTLILGLGGDDNLDPGEAQRMLAHPLPYWVERMTIGYVQTYGGRAERKARAWEIGWPDEDQRQLVVFSIKDAERVPAARHLTLGESRVRALATNMPRIVPGQPIPCITLDGVPAEVRGLWTLWEITAEATGWSAIRVLPLFVHDDGRTLAPTARFIWDQLLTCDPVIAGWLEGEAGSAAFDRVESVAREHSRQVYDAIVRQHGAELAKERERRAFGLAARRRAAERIGLEAVRQHRLAQLAAEELAWESDLLRKSDLIPELIPLLLLRVDGGKIDA